MKTKMPVQDLVLLNILKKKVDWHLAEHELQVEGSPFAVAAAAAVAVAFLVVKVVVVVDVVLATVAAGQICECLQQQQQHSGLNQLEDENTYHYVETERESLDWMTG